MMMREIQRYDLNDSIRFVWRFEDDDVNDTNMDER
jgi:hypothetical protein